MVEAEGWDPCPLGPPADAAGAGSLPTLPDDVAHLVRDDAPARIGVSTAALR